ncbi:MAG: AAA family ATPase [Gaiellaceae bacterium]
MQTATRSRARIVGREVELAAVAATLESDEPGALVLWGEPGIGKTTLWEAGLDAASERRTSVLCIRPGPQVQPSFAGLIDLFDQIDVAAVAGLPAPQRRALEVALLRIEPAGPPLEPQAIALGLLNVLRALVATERLVVAVDDVQWLDPPSAAALTYAARRLEGSEVAFLLARRFAGTSPLERAVEWAGAIRIEIGPLSLGAIRQLLTESLDLSLPRRMLLRLHEVSQGNPMLALELGRTLGARTPDDEDDWLPVTPVLEEMLGVRVLQLSQPVRRLLLAVASSAEARLSHLEAIVGTAVVEQALDAGVLVRYRERLRPSHPLLAEAVRAHAQPSERRAVHLELADVVSEKNARARHLALGTDGPDPGIAATVSAAAARAGARGATDDALELARHALRLTRLRAAARSDRVLALAEHLLVAGKPREASRLVAGELDRLPAGSPRARAHLLLADGRFVDSHVEDFELHLQQALAESRSDPALRAIAVARKAQYTAVACVERIRDAERWACEALPAGERAGWEVECEVLWSLGWARSLRGRPIDDLLERTRTAAGTSVHTLRSLERIEAERLAWRGNCEQARAAYARLLEQADARGEAWSYVVLRQQLCELELRVGDWRAAADVLDDWEQSRDEELLGTPAYSRCRALLAAGRGLPDEADRWADETIAASDARPLRWNLLEALRARGIAALLVHEPERAVESLRVVWEHTQREAVDEPGVFPVAPDLVEALVELGEPDEASAVSERLARRARQQGHPWGLATAARCRSIVRLARGPYDERAAAELSAAALAYERLGLRFDHARSLLSLGRAQRRARKWGAARASLEEATGAFAGIGSVGWAAGTRAELGRVGARRPRPTGQLTPAERRVAELAAEGLSNKEIAARLFVTAHTVEVHLSHGYGKLGVRSRSQLAHALKD